MHVWIQVYIYTHYIHLCMHVCIHVYIYTHTHTPCVYVRGCVCVCVCVCVCTYIDHRVLGVVVEEEEGVGTLGIGVALDVVREGCLKNKKVLKHQCPSMFIIQTC